MPKNYGKAHELLGHAADLGLPAAHHTLGAAYSEGTGVAKDEKKCMHYWRLAAIGGMLETRFCLGVKAYEAEEQNMDLAMKHWIISAEAGHDASLKMVKAGYANGCVKKEVFAKALRSHKAAADMVRSEQRDKIKGEVEESRNKLYARRD